MNEKMVTLTLNYADMATVEFALADFLENSRRHVTSLQHQANVKDGVFNNERRTLIQMYQNRIKKANYLLGEVGALLATAADELMPEEK